MSGTDLAPICEVQHWHRVAWYGSGGHGRTDESDGRVVSLDRRGTALRAPYALSGADAACGSIGLRACDAVSGTDTAYGGISVRAPYAMSGTDLAYGGRAGDRRRGQSPLRHR
eukprot:2795448-Rhodomonas_salina.1